ncbi:MAG: DNA internalization-related competence protein ComEC/Rec2 [Gammaproteobacteria bacterium]|nr:MAG: DNA internalization-related competence protein ComEC/Rec2 [Gammaproteobacteria bacterium]
MQSWMTGIVLGIVPVGLLPQLPGWPVLLPLVGAAVVLLRWRTRPARLASGLALGCVLAICYGTSLIHKRLAADCVKLPLTLTGEVSSLPRTSRMPDGTLRQRFEFSVGTIDPSRCQGPSRLLLSYYGPRKMVPGDRWQFGVKLKKPWGLANPGSFNMQAWFTQSGIDGVGSVRAGRAQRLPPGNRLSTAHHRLRLQISEHIAALAMERDVRAILRAITVADKSGIDARLWSLLQQFGVNHLLVISGLHVGLVAGAGYVMGGLSARLLYLGAGLGVAWLPGVLALVFACAYAALAGFSLATQRALCMLACFILANLVGRSSGSGNNLLLAAVLVLVSNPLAALGSGFWLSFGAVAALLWLSSWQRGAGLCQRLLSTHAFMALVMLPMGAWWFGGSSLVGALANLLMIPLVGFIVVPLALLAVVSFLLGWPLESGLWQLASWPLQKLLPLAVDLVDSSGHWLYQYFAPDLSAVLLALLAVALLIIPAGIPTKLLASVLALPLLLPAIPAPASANQSTRVTVLDVGQGTAIVIRAGQRTLLYDTGGGDPAGANMATAVILPYLRKQAVEALDTFVVSHPDTDHSAGTAAVLQAMPVARFRYGAELAGVRGGRPCVAGEAWRWPGGQSFQFLSPARETALVSNDSSCVLQVQIGAYRQLLTGDIEGDRERELVRYWGRTLRSDWLLAAHHGSLTSSSQALLKTVRPTVVILSNGYANRFGHPHPRVLERLKNTDATVLSTVESGALEFDFTPGQPPVVRAYRVEKRRFWM